jgi:hypothetical protein
MPVVSQLSMRARLAGLSPVALLLLSACGQSGARPPQHSAADEPTPSLPTYLQPTAPASTSSAPSAAPPPSVPTASAPQPLPSAATTVGKLLAHFTFDDCSARDATGNGHDGRAIGKPACVEGAIGKALQFDGKQYLTIEPIVSDDSLRSQITVTGWVKASGYDDGYKRVVPVLTLGHAGFMKAPFAVGYEVLGGKLMPTTTLANAAGQTYSTRLFPGGGVAQRWFFFAWVFQA